MDADLLVVGLAVLAFGCVAGRLEGSPLTMPMLFTGVGVLLAPGVLGVLELDVDTAVVGVLAEAALALVLFADASRMDLRRVARHHAVAQRLLVLGLPLAVLVGAGAGLLLLGELPLAAAALLAAILAPTDAALGQAFVADDAVPADVRQTLEVESGLNDGLAVAFVIVLLDLARGQAGGALGYVGQAVQLIGVGTAVALVVGGVGGRLLEAAARRGTSTPSGERMATLALAAIAFGGSELLGGNGFIATFGAGLVVGSAAQTLLPHTDAFAETEGQVLTLVTFLVFGTVVVVDVVGAVTWSVVLYAVVSLVVVRPVAVALSLVGSGVPAGTRLYLAWAGPRGLASIVYAVLVAETAGVPGGEEVFVVAACTVVLSILLHGTSAGAASARYAASVGRKPRESTARPNTA